MPMDRVRAGIAAAVQELSNDLESADAASEAIMTSDTRSKQVAVRFKLGGRMVSIGGMCKGAGMIQPGMSDTGARPPAAPAGLHATMLCFLTSDAAVDAAVLQSALRESVALSFNRITVDGDMSTNDTVLLLANGLAQNPMIDSTATPGFRIFQAALNQVTLELAKMIVRDGEGVSRLVTVRLRGARNAVEADAAARSVANSALVKTSWHGGDPNWGRIVDALGYSAARVVEEAVDIGYSSPGSSKILWSVRKGQPTTASFPTLCRAVSAREFDLHIHLNQGKGEAVIYAADLTEEYVDFNKGSIGDPASMGG